MKTAARPCEAVDIDAAPDGTGALDEIFGALADPTRRAIVARLTEGPCSVSALIGSGCRHGNPIDHSSFPSEGRIAAAVLIPINVSSCTNWP